MSSKSSKRETLYAIQVGVTLDGKKDFAIIPFYRKPRRCLWEPFYFMGKWRKHEDVIAITPVFPEERRCPLEIAPNISFSAE